MCVCEGAYIDRTFIAGKRKYVYATVTVSRNGEKNKRKHSNHEAIKCSHVKASTFRRKRLPRDKVVAREIGHARADKIDGVGLK